MLYTKVLEKKQEMQGFTCNPVMDAFNLDLCKVLDELAKNDKYVKRRLYKTIDLLNRTEGLDFNDYFRSAFEAYNEAVIYYLLKLKGVTINNIPEKKIPTPDFEVKFESENNERELDIKSIFIEVKTLSFAEGNLQYCRAQQSALEANIKLEDQFKRGRHVCSAEYEVVPFGAKVRSLTDEIEILINKIDQNIKEEQYKYNDGKDTILLVSLSQYIFPCKDFESLPIYLEKHLKCCVSGRQWMVAFGRIGDRVYIPCEFEGKPNIDDNLNNEGILNCYPYIKGIIFCSGSSVDDIHFYGFYRYKEYNSDSARFIREICDLYNDDQNSNGYSLFDAMMLM